MAEKLGVPFPGQWFGADDTAPTQDYNVYVDEINKGLDKLGITNRPSTPTTPAAPSTPKIPLPGGDWGIFDTIDKAIGNVMTGGNYSAVQAEGVAATAPIRGFLGEWLGRLTVIILGLVLFAAGVFLLGRE